MNKIKSNLRKLDKFLLKLKTYTKFKTILKQKIRINTLTIENEDLKNKVEELELVLKNKLYEDFINKYKEPELIEKLTKENKRLRKNNKELKENKKGDKNE